MLAADLAAGALGGEFGQTGGPTGGISGNVYVTQAVGSCDSHGAINSLADVRLQLLDESGTVLEESVTDDQGAYQFSNLMPGQYSVRQLTPAGFFEGASHVGDGGGIALDMNQVGEILVQANEVLSGYDFCDYASDPEPTGPAGPTNRPIVPHGPIAPDDAETGSLNQAFSVLTLSLQQTPATSSEIVFELVVTSATDASLSEITPLILSQSSEIFGGSSRSLKEPEGIKIWEESPIDDWFSTVNAWDLASSDLMTIDQFEPFLGQTEESQTEENSDKPFADGYTVNAIEWYEGDARVKLDQSVEDAEIIHPDTQQAATAQTATPQIASRAM